tara:strand:+ start:4212 stop:5846 length:1635 start_codon:yes stop_codon:yes gene_type:complete
VLALSGFMGAGKSTIGTRLARLLGAGFVDLDAEIEWAFALPVDEIFRVYGEPAFREMESRLLKQALSVQGRVLALGGGAVLELENRELLRASATWVNLDVDLSTACMRLLDAGKARPLLGSDAELRALYLERAPIYAQAPHRVVAEGDPGDVAARIESLIATLEGRTPAVPASFIPSCRERVELPGRGYDVVIGSNNLDELAAELARLGSGPIALLSDWNVAPLHADKLLRAVAATGRELLQVTLPAGEERKGIGPVLEATDQLLEAGWRRDGVVLALGGGVLGDMAGLVAALCLRGLPFVQVPTTVLAMVDSCVGGKVGVNHRSGKNLLGAFHQPALVWADLSLLDTLPDRYWRAGLAEVVKTALIGDEVLLELLETKPIALLERDPVVMAEVVRRCTAFKAQVVVADERESGARRILNFGHTVAHGLETALGFGHLLHGEAVAVGMVAALEIGHVLGWTERPLIDRLRSILRSLGLPVSAPEPPPGLLSRSMERDKKLVESGITWVLLKDVCQPQQHVLPLSGLEDLLSQLRERGVLLARGE